MWRFCVGALAVLMLVPAVRAQDDTEKKVEPPTPAQQYAQLTSEYQKFTQELGAKYQKADAAERQKILADHATQTNKIAEKCWTLYNENPEDRVASSALRWILQYGSRTPTATTAATSLLEEAAKDPENSQSLSNVVLVATRTSGPVAKKATDMLMEMIEAKRDDPTIIATLTSLVRSPSSELAQKTSQILIELIESNKDDTAMITPLTALISSRTVEKETVEKATQMLVALIDSNKDDPKMITPLTALISSRTTPKELANKATAILIDNFVDNDQLAAICLRLSNQDALRQVIEKSTNDSVKGHAMLSLGKVLAGRPVTANAEAEELLAKVVSDYGDIASARGTLGKLAEGPLFEMQHLQIGMAAPNIEGEDVDSEAFQLADYKGKVIVLDFWGDW